MKQLLCSLWLLVLAAHARASELNVLFIGNSFTARHHLVRLIKAMAESADPSLRFNATEVIYGGSTLRDQWILKSPNFVRIAELTREEEAESLEAIEHLTDKEAKSAHRKAALTRHQELLASLDKARPRWDVVVLQSYRDDIDGEKSSYLEYAPRFAGLAKRRGARVVLYETTPATQNEKPLSAPPDPAPVRAKEEMIARLAQTIGASVVPMSSVALACQTARPELTLRYVNDAHLNQTMAYLTACTFYAVLFDRSPVGLKVASVTDTRSLEGHRDQNRDGGPITRVFSEQERTELQRIAWQGLQQFRKIAAAAR